LTGTRKIAVTLAVLVIAYALAFVFFVDSSELPSLGWRTIAVLGLAALIQLGGLWMFGELFRHGIEATGSRISTGLGFRAALVGATVARLLPVGGAVTPVAMAWAVRDRASGAGGAAVRATGLNYGGLLITTGACLLIASRGPSMESWGDGLAVASLLALVVGLIVLVGASRLGTLGDLLPKRLRRRFGQGLIDVPIDLRSHAFLWARLGAEVVVLWVVLTTFGIDLGIAQLVAAFGLSQIAAGIPGTPGGAGFAEAGLVGALALFGVGGAVAPVLIFRIISYWVPAAAGLLAGSAAFVRSSGSVKEHEHPVHSARSRGETRIGD